MAKKRDEIDKMFHTKWPMAGLDTKHRLAFRGSIARELYALESEEYQQQIQVEVQELHAADVEFAKAAPPQVEMGVSDADQRAM